MSAHRTSASKNPREKMIETCIIIHSENKSKSSPHPTNLQMPRCYMSGFSPASPPPLEVCGRLNEGIGFKEYLHGPMDEGTKLKVKFRTGDIDLQERRRRFRKVDEDDKFKCECGTECEDRVHVVAECPFYNKERSVHGWAGKSRQSIQMVV